MTPSSFAKLIKQLASISICVCLISCHQIFDRFAADLQAANGSMILFASTKRTEDVKAAEHPLATRPSDRDSLNENSRLGRMAPTTETSISSHLLGDRRASQEKIRSTVSMESNALPNTAQEPNNSKNKKAPRVIPVDPARSALASSSLNYKAPTSSPSTITLDRTKILIIDEDGQPLADTPDN